jgi:hypothetical protein
MNQNEDFRKSMDSVMDVIVRELGEAKGPNRKEPLVTQSVLKMLSNLNKRLIEQTEHIVNLEERMKNYEKNFKILIHELNESGYIALSERRKNLKRTVLSQEAMAHLLIKKKILSQKELVQEIKKRKKPKAGK